MRYKKIITYPKNAKKPFWLLFLVHKTSYSVFEIRSFGNIRKTGSEYLKTLDFCHLCGQHMQAWAFPDRTEQKKHFVGMHEERGKMKRRRVSCQLSTPVYLVVLDLATTHAAVPYVVHHSSALSKFFFLKKEEIALRRHAPNFLATPETSLKEEGGEGYKQERKKTTLLYFQQTESRRKK